MAKKKQSEFPVKAALVDADHITILDSETSDPVLQNKKALGSVVKNYILPEGSWTPLITGVTVTNNIGYYIRKNSSITLIWSFSVPVNTVSAVLSIQGLPNSTVAAGTGKPNYYFGMIGIFVNGVSIATDNVCGIGAGNSAIITYAPAAPNGQQIQYFSGQDVYGSITYRFK